MYAWYAVDEDGRITRSGFNSKLTDCYASLLEGEELHMGVAVQDEQYWDGVAGELAERTSLPLIVSIPEPFNANGSDMVTISNIPDDATVYVDGDPVPMDGETSFGLSVDDPGTYRIWIDEVEHLREEWNIEAV